MKSSCNKWLLNNTSSYVIHKKSNPNGLLFLLSKMSIYNIQQTQSLNYANEYNV